eukprot:CAMPEP_0204215452 /NCGR_PEP_ID=MMETSP0361-20130328/77462_1 /ASSEMBLY_ACC=CAM_ASM_000343 /TAXON_ID=268821 /ORGANISM="Scrippsiella Hangoei, Strain SHTV-5" /LENGTH=92 /DNA_ID=CAMNT_0051180197 /DNA_START=123 /DNA_END=398 /DNA_ORIENTATION=+
MGNRGRARAASGGKKTLEIQRTEKRCISFRVVGKESHQPCQHPEWPTTAPAHGVSPFKRSTQERGHEASLPTQRFKCCAVLTTCGQHPHAPM